jgi:hypothetical protein
MRPVSLTITSLVDDANGVAEAQTLAGAEEVSLDGVLVSNGIAVIDPAGKLTINSSGDDSGITFAVVGTYNGIATTETITGANAGDATSTYYYSEVISITSSGATDGDIYVGVLAANGAVSKPIQVDWRQSPYNAGLAVEITGTMTCSAQHSFADPQNDSNPIWFTNGGISGVTSSTQGNLSFPVRIVRLLISAYTSGSVTFRYVQAIGD